MTVIIMGGDELARAGCESLIDNSLDIIKLDPAGDPNSMAHHLSRSNLRWVVVLGWSIDVEAVVKSVHQLCDSPPGMILVNAASAIETDPDGIRKGLDLGFNGILSADSDLSALNGILSMPPNEVVYVSREIIDAAVSKRDSLGPGPTESPEMASILAANTNILDCIAKGWSNKEIARDLDVSEDRIKARVRQIMRTLGVNKRTQLAATYLQFNPSLPTNDDDRTSSNEFDRRSA